MVISCMDQLNFELDSTDTSITGWVDTISYGWDPRAEDYKLQTTEVLI